MSYPHQSFFSISNNINELSCVFQRFLFVNTKPESHDYFRNSKEHKKNFFEENNSLEIEVIIQNGFVSKYTIESRWLGYPGTTEEEIRKKEQILNALKASLS